jgi:hypothetical protein
MVHDNKLLGVCGETQISNANLKQSIITMIQLSPLLRRQGTI